ncbi:MAG: response regulator transcription factor [Tenericutes bacterium]|nr:response regulator transcription factor [Mycoplasmatota bacterium]MDY3801759.1 response regulator transcription factor [Bacilli bacterium]
MNILIADDEKLIRNVLKEYLLVENYHVFEANDGKEVLDIIRNNCIDLILLDIMMPNMDGFSALKEIKKENNIPVIVLSARKEEYDKLLGFDLGIDDYITKPFSPKEVMARIKAVLKRNNMGENFTYKDLVIDYMGHTVKINNEELKLTPKEYEILIYLVKNKGIAISREAILSKIWGYTAYCDDRTVDTHIKKLRNNLGKDYRDLITTVRNIGYKFEIK